MEPATPSRSAFSRVALIIVFAVAYFIAGKLGLKLAFVHVQVSAVWPPTGIALAVLLLWGYRLWPGVLLGAFLVNVTTGAVAVPQTLAALGIAAGNTLEALLGAYLVQRFAGGRRAFRRAQHVFTFTAAAMVSTAVSATFGVTALSLAGLTPWPLDPAIWLNWWIGDTVGALVFAPLLILGALDAGWRWARSRVVEAGILLLTACVLPLVAFTRVLPPTPPRTSLAFLCIPPLLWAAFRFGGRGVALTMLPISGIGIWGAISHGLMAGELPPEAVLLELQVYLGMMSVMFLAVAAEVSHRRQHELTLERHAGILREQAKVVELAPLLVRDTDDRIVRWNAGAEGLYGFTSAEARGKISHTLLQTRFPEPLERIRAKLFAEGSWQGEVLHKTREGREVVVASRHILHRDKHGAPSAILEVSNDVTELKRAQEKFQLAVESAPNAMVMVNQQGRIVLANRQTENLFGYSRTELMGQSVEVLVPARFRERHPEHRQSFFSEPHARPMGAGRDLYGLRKDRTEFPVEIGLNPIETEEGTWVLSAIVDISERKRAQESLRESAERLQLALEAGRMGVWEWDMASGRVTWSTGLEAIHGLAPNTFGGTFEAYIADAHPEDRPLVMQSITRSLQEKVDHDIEYRIVRPDGGTRWVQGKGRVIQDPRGNVLGMSGVCMDITDRKQAEQERRSLLAREQAARTEAERANRLKDEFLATVSHELRTPLAAVLGWAQLLQSSSLDESTRERALRVIEHNSKIQAKLIEDILDVSRVVSGKLLLDLHPVQVPAIIDAAIETIRPAAESEGVRIETVIEPDVGAVQGDSERLQQVVWNLLSNAVKFTPRGGRIEVHLERRDSQMEIRVSDTGEGIQAEFLPHVFDAFRQADGSSSRRHGGLGLGLAIVRQVVELHGGTVHAYSDGPGAGTTFTIRLPLLAKDPFRKDGAPESLPETVPALSGLRVLVVEDDPDTRQLLTVLLENHGVNVTATASTREAVQAFRLNRPDVLISDIGLPGEDGYALLRQIRALGAEKGGDIPALALTAYARSEDREQALAAGFQMHLPKPINPLLLTRAIENVARTGPAIADRTEKEPSRRIAFKVAVIDDAKDVADLFAMTLRDMGHEVHIFYDGPAALNQIGAIRPDIVFSDISMHEMNGYELVKRLREMPGLRDSTFVAITGFGQAEDGGHTLRAGFDYHLVKPLLLPQLRAFFAELAKRDSLSRAAAGLE